MLEALAGINHVLMAVNSNISKLMASCAATFKRHEAFMGRLSSLMLNACAFERAMYLEYEFLRDDRSRTLNTIDAARKRAKEQLACAKTFPEDWGRDAYIDSIGDLLDHLHQLQAEIYQLGTPFLFNCYTKSSKAAFPHYQEKWGKFTM